MLLENLEQFERRVRELRSAIREAYGSTGRVNKAAIRAEALALSTFWYTVVRPEIESMHPELLANAQDVDAGTNRLNTLSSPNNLVSSYLSATKQTITKFKERFLTPVRFATPKQSTSDALSHVLSKIASPDESNYLTEAIACARSTFLRASVVMGWCAAVDRIQRTVEKIGLDKFNVASRSAKAKGGRFKWFKKEFDVSSISELQKTIADGDLLVVVEEMGLVDAHKGDRLQKALELRNDCAHPGTAPLLDVHLASFYTDLDAIVFSNPTFY